ncbi:phosphatases II [Lindgomyces ingoldianus]|uniref:Phosphatases II n=1 Tax=Lindgomyces ingoldianus TaxID=673940 RepID=A0ACB6QRP5_9PLEO|nr:phosphatases II [Lindgomyces ingoldianus]KAF2469195.1 phosphatases II [Lindgomyces ingoldianus]
MGWLDFVPRTSSPRLYIGGLYALYQTSLIEDAGITHVLSIINYDPLLQERFAHLKHLHIRAEDDPNEDLIKWFARANRFIEGAGQGGDSGGSGDGNESENGKGAVFIHCAMGKSRSATFVVAYLMWKYKISWEAALEQLCEGRPVCDPNVGFKEQLGVYEKVLAAMSEDEAKGIYEKWERERFKGEWWEWDKRERGKKKEKASL